MCVDGKDEMGDIMKRTEEEEEKEGGKGGERGKEMQERDKVNRR